MPGVVPRLEVLWQVALVAFAGLESQQEADAPTMVYEDVLQQVHRQFAAQFGLQTSGILDAAFGNSLPHWPAFSDTADAAVCTVWKTCAANEYEQLGDTSTLADPGVVHDLVDNRMNK